MCTTLYHIFLKRSYSTVIFISDTIYITVKYIGCQGLFEIFFSVIEMELYKSIKTVAKSKGCSITKMEKDLGLGKSVTSKFDEHAPSIEKIAKIADYFNVSIDTLVGRKTSMSITEDELLLLTVYRQLNNQGKNVLLDYADTLVQSKKYKSEESYISDEA